MFSLTHWVLFLSVVTKCPFILGVRFWKNQNSSAFKKYSNFRLACAKGESVAIERKRGFSDPLGATFPPILGNFPGFSLDPLTHWVRVFRAHFPRANGPGHCHPLGARVPWVAVPTGCAGAGCRPLGQGCSGAGESGSEGEGVGPAGSMVRLRRHHRNRENFLEN